MSSNQIALIIVAAGSSTRMGNQIKKEYLPLGNETVLSKVALTFLKTNKINSIVIVVPKNDKQKAKTLIAKSTELSDLLKKLEIIPSFIIGGSSRQKSVFNALEFLNSLQDKPDYVLIHDGARPFISLNLAIASCNFTIKYGASVPAITPIDTLKEVDSKGFITNHLERKTLRCVQTPQGFSFSDIYACHKKASLEKKEFTDDTEIYDLYSGKKTFVFDGEFENKKITYQCDISSYKNIQRIQEEKKMFRTGIGYDKHRLVENRKLILGGIEIPYEKGEDGHSDGDAVLHAIADALLGASHCGDIGSFFPDTDSAYKDADSKKLLSIVWKTIKENGFSLENLDVVIILENPKFLPYRQKVINSIAQTLDVDSEKIFVKAKTGEKLGDVGNGSCIEVFAICLLSK